MEDQIEKTPRIISGQLIKSLKQISINSAPIGNLLDWLSCPICKCGVEEPVVIKHCLHFFCKECIDRTILNFKKECPICKIELRTKRETRMYEKLKVIMGLLQHQID